jgi:predicted DNA-binding transcriptional regulator YafY
MDRSERFHLIDQMLSNRRVVSRQQFLEALEISPATFKRDLEYLRDRLGAPIVWDRETRGYRYDRSNSADGSFQLPGLWFNAGELQALLMMDAWLENLQPGLIGEHIKPLQARIRMLLDESDFDAGEITRRMRILAPSRRGSDNRFFSTLSQALMSRKQLQIRHFNRNTGVSSERPVSPQRLTYYRDNWYLDAWCHVRDAIRSFAVDALQDVELLGEQAIEVEEALLERELSSGYGIFSGEARHSALLRFSPHRARWVSGERWHPNQSAEFEADGHYLLRVPYSQEPELVMDILKYGADVEVLEPESLRLKVAQEVAKMARVYRENGPNDSDDG